MSEILMVRGDTLQLSISSIKTQEGEDYVLTDTDTTVDGLTGADTYFRIDKLTNESNGTTALRLVLVNKKTGETHISGTTVYSNNVKWKIESISFSGVDKRSAVRVTVKGYRNGESVNVLSKVFDGRASAVGGTSFGENGAQTAITQT